MKLKKKIGALFSKYREGKEILQDTDLCGVTLKTLPGTIRAKNDMDDAWFFYLAKNHEVIFDLGANIGYTAMLAGILNPNRRYILVDPNPKALAKASLNLLSNSLGFNASYYTAFVSDKNDEEVTFYTIGSGAAGSMHTSHAQSAAFVNSYTKVSTVTLDTLYSYYGIPPHLVKVDVEGAELLVLEGAKKTAQESQCTFIVEMHRIDDMTMEDMGNEIVKWCQQMNYRSWYMKTQEPMANGSVIKDRGKCHLLLLPKTKDYPTYLKEIQQGDTLPKHL